MLWNKTSKGETQFNSASQVSGFVYQVAKNKWLDQLGSARVRKNQSIEGLSFSFEMTNEDVLNEEIEHENQLSVLKNAFSHLGENCKKILSMFYYEKKSMVDIGVQMNLDPASARNQKYRCMNKLKEIALKK